MVWQFTVLLLQIVDSTGVVNPPQPRHNNVDMLDVTNIGPGYSSSWLPLPAVLGEDLSPLLEGDVQVPEGGGGGVVEQHGDGAVVVPRDGLPL